MKIKKKFQYQGIELQIVERDESKLTFQGRKKAIRVLAPNGGTIPLQIQHRQTLKSIVELTIKTLDGFKTRGADVIEILTKAI